ncbi:hypothetical protein AB6A40_008180 [Gnathostoma spinigerum]|uniref:Uncharacterized protein n=1 Tax=Gnathostoma spinigerum TaxID=75299 RepID=A0ABD6ENT3_9BILA
MTLFKNLLCLAIGLYGGAYMDQQYELPRMPSPEELVREVERRIQEYLKPKEN